MRSSPNPVIVFGLKQLATLAWHGLTHDSDYRVVAFTVDAAFIDRDSLHGLPVVPFESLPETLPPDDFALHVPIGWKRMNALRAEKAAQGRAMGYRLASYISRRALVWPDLQLGDNCSIYQGATIGPFVRLGDNCAIFGAASIGHHSTIGSDCYIAGRAMISGGVTIGEQCVIGANCTIIEGVRIAPRCLIGAGAVITRDTRENEVYTAKSGTIRKVPSFRVPRML